MVYHYPCTHYINLVVSTSLPGYAKLRIMVSRDRKAAAAWVVALLFLLPARVYAQAPNQIGPLLVQMQEIAEQALESSRKAEQAATVADVKRHADDVFIAVWGMPSGLIDESARGAAFAHGWKTNWQVTYSDFDSLFAARYGNAPPEITDPSNLGIVGRGRAVRRALEASVGSSGASSSLSTHGPHVVHSINNVIGWMKMDDGVTKGERQPRVDLTREWDSPVEFWMSTADTGWLFEAYSQASNILKTNYEGDVATARSHAAAMTQLLEKALNGVDVNGNGSVEPAKMEGGLRTAVQHAHLGELIQ